ncbi:MAG: ATP-binding cassette domain-containing protein [Steroidobacteraceae bacterium]
MREVFWLVWSRADTFVKARLTAALLLVTVASALTALGPVLLKRIVDRLAGAETEDAIPLGIWVGAYALIQWIGRAVGESRGLIFARAERRMSRRLSERLFAHILRLPLRFHLDRQTGAVTQSLTNGLQGYQAVLHTVAFSILPVAAELGATFVVLARLGKPAFLALFGGAIVCYAIVFSYAAYRTMKAARCASAAQVEAIATMTDSVLNYETVKHFAAETVVERKVGGALIRTEEEWVRFYRQYAANGLLVATIYTAFLATTILYATSQVQVGWISIGTFVLVNTYMLQILRPVEQLGYAVQSLSQGVAYLEKMLELFREEAEADGALLPESEQEVPWRSFGKAQVNMTPAPCPGESTTVTDFVPEKQGGDGPRAHPARPAELEFRNVSLSYRSDRAVLQGVSFRIPAGKTLGLVGTSGCGKSTVVRLLVRLLEPDSGEILLDGIPIQAMPLGVLRQCVAIVPQDTVLFNDTIGYNIEFGRPGSSLEDIQRAAQLAHLHDFILSLPEGYDTRVGERGVKLSGGEKQRVSIARVAIKSPRLYVFDEATSSLDSRSERDILRNLAEISRHSTTIVIAHRLSTVVHADEIAVLEGGIIVERGTHECLLSCGSRYAKLWEAQHPGPVAA